MNDLNSILLEGNLTRDAEIKYLNSGTPVLNFSIASNRYYKKEGATDWTQDVSYFDCVVFGKAVEYCKDKALKGRGVRIIGQIKQDRYTDKDNNPKSKVKIIAERVEFKPPRQNAPETTSAPASDFSDDVAF